MIELFKKGKEAVLESYVFWFGIPIPKPSNFRSYKMLLFVDDFSFKRGKVEWRGSLSSYMLMEKPLLGEFHFLEPVGK